jgi:hypothetical protein
VSYRPVLTVRAAAQFADLIGQQEVYEAFMDRLLRLVGARGMRGWCSQAAASPSFGRPCSVAKACWRSG